MSINSLASEIEVLEKEYNWLLQVDVHNVIKHVKSILVEACRRFPVRVSSVSVDENLVKPEKFLLSNQSGNQNSLRCMITLMGDCICEADLQVKFNRQQPTPFRSNIQPDIPWKLQQVQDAGNHVVNALHLAESRENGYVFKSGEEVMGLLDEIINSLQKGRTSLIIPKKKTLSDLVKNHNLKAFRPSIPNEMALSFYIQAQKLVMAVYHLYVNSNQKVDISARHQVESSVPWLNDVLVLFTLALHECQQLRDKISVFMQYEEEQTFHKQQQSVIGS